MHDYNSEVAVPLNEQYAVADVCAVLAVNIAFKLVIPDDCNPPTKPPPGVVLTTIVGGARIYEEKKRFAIVPK